MPDDRPFILRQADQARTDVAAIESDLSFMMERIAALPTHEELI